MIHFYEKRDEGRITPTYEVENNSDSNYDYSIITLNYDLVLETFCEFLKSHYTSALDLAFHDELDDEIGSPILTKLHGNVRTRKIIPPTWNKILYDDDIKQAWSIAYKLLQEANHIRI